MKRKKMLVPAPRISAEGLNRTSLQDIKTRASAIIEDASNNRISPEQFVRILLPYAIATAQLMKNQQLGCESGTCTFETSDQPDLLQRMAKEYDTDIFNAVLKYEVAQPNEIAGILTKWRQAITQDTAKFTLLTTIEGCIKAECAENGIKLQ